MKKTILIVIASIAGLLLLVAIGLYIYFMMQFSVYQDAQYKFSIKYPKNWEVIAHPQPTVAVVFRRPKDTAMDLLQENFSVVIQPVSFHDRTSEALGESIKKQMTAVFGKSVSIVEDKSFHLSWRDAHQLAFDAPKPDHLKMVNAWVIRSGQAYIMTFFGDMNKYSGDSLNVHEMIHSLDLQ